MRRNRTFIGPQGMGGLVSLWGASSLIKSRQSGFVTLGVSAQGNTTINAVDMANSVLYYNGFYENIVAAGRPYYVLARVYLQSATNVRASMDTASGTDGVLYFTVIEFMPGVLKSVQRIAIGIANGTTNGTAAITEVNLAKTTLTWEGVEYAGTEVYGTTDPKNWLPYATINSTTQVTLFRPGSANACTSYNQVVEFF